MDFVFSLDTETFFEFLSRTTMGNKLGTIGTWQRATGSESEGVLKKRSEHSVGVDFVCRETCRRPTFVQFCTVSWAPRANTSPAHVGVRSWDATEKSSTADVTAGKRTLNTPNAKAAVPALGRLY